MIEGASRRCPTCGAAYPLDFLVCPKDAISLDRPGGDEDPLVSEVLAGSFRIKPAVARRTATTSTSRHR